MLTYKGKRIHRGTLSSLSHDELLEVALDLLDVASIDNLCELYGWDTTDVEPLYRYQLSWVWSGGLYEGTLTAFDEADARRSWDLDHLDHWRYVGPAELLADGLISVQCTGVLS